MEKVYKAMKNAGIMNIVMGIVVLVTGVASGVMLIISGSILLNKKRKLMF